MLAKPKECDDTMEAKWFKHVGLVTHGPNLEVLKPRPSLCFVLGQHIFFLTLAPSILIALTLFLIYILHHETSQELPTRPGLHVVGCWHLQ